MRLEEALGRVGAEVVKSKADKTQAVVFLRVATEQGEKWVECVHSLLLGLEGKPFTIDVSKYFFASGGEVKYLWRVVVDGDVTAALTFWAACCMQAHMNHVPEITSMPLVGRKKYPFDPARGLIKGGHVMETAPGILNMAIGGGVVGGVS